MIYNYHTHTYFCDHADGEPREYIENAIAGGIKYMGFSEHCPLKYPDGSESSYRMQTKDAEKYFKLLNTLREEYKDKIWISIGFEMEYYPIYFDEMLKNATKFGAEYLILGQHFLNSGEREGVKVTEKTASEERLALYSDTVIEGMKSGSFTYVAHPDIINYVNDDEAYEREMRRICMVSREYNVPLEINFLGIRGGRIYPRDAFWKVAGEEKCPVVMGFDAHSAEAAYDGASLIKAKAFVEKYQLNLIEHPQLVSIV